MSLYFKEGYIVVHGRYEVKKRKKKKMDFFFFDVGDVKMQKSVSKTSRDPWNSWWGLILGCYNKCAARLRSFVSVEGGGDGVRWIKHTISSNFVAMSLFWGYLPGGCPHIYIHTYTLTEWAAPPNHFTTHSLYTTHPTSRRQISSGIYFSLSRYGENFELPEDAENYYNQGKRRFWVLLTTFTHNFAGIHHRPVLPPNIFSLIPSRIRIRQPQRSTYVLEHSFLDFNYRSTTNNFLIIIII